MGEGEPGDPVLTLPKPRCNWATNSNGLKGRLDCQFQRQTRPTESFSVSVSVTAIPREVWAVFLGVQPLPQRGEELLLAHRRDHSRIG